MNENKVKSITYDDLLCSHLKYGTTSEDIIIRAGYEKILENVVIAPCWSHDIFNNLGFEIKQVSEKVFNLYGEKLSFSYIELNGIGSPAIIDFILSLGITKCKNLIFLGSAGSLDKNIKIGDIVIPKYSICGDGASRYLNKNLKDEFLKEEYPTETITSDLINILKQKNIKYHYVPNFSTDAIFAQFYHVDKILELGAKTIEMETANLFKCCVIMDINVTALFCISDNTVSKKSLYSGRTAEENKHRHKVRYEIVPKIVTELFKKLEDNVYD